MMQTTKISLGLCLSLFVCLDPVFAANFDPASMNLAFQSISQLQQLQRLSRSMNVSHVVAAGGRVARELSKTLNTDVFAVGKALAGAGAAVGSLVFLGGMGALLATGMGAFKYSPNLFEGAVSGSDKSSSLHSARSAKALYDVKRPTNPELVPALNDLVAKLYDVLENGVPQFLDRR